MTEARGEFILEKLQIGGKLWRSEYYNNTFKKGTVNWEFYICQISDKQKLRISGGSR